jgi:broad specificity phosphatase PhoE
MKVYLVRHGDVFNPKGLIYGRLPGFKLSETGIKEVNKAGKYLDSLGAKPEIIITSPLLRTVQTAKIIQTYFPDVEIVKEKKIIEGNIGWQGIVKKDLIRRKIWNQYLSAPSSIDTGERFSGVQKRVVEWAKEFAKKPYEQAVVVSHQDLIRSLILFLQGRPLDDLNKFPAATGSVTVIGINKDAILQGDVKYWQPS